MKLYSHPGSCSSSAHIALNEAGQKFDLVKFDLFSDRILPDGRHFSEINPKGYVPVLELDNGELITEIVVVLQYIADLHPDSGLAPANGSLERIRLQEWLAFLNCEVHMTMGLFFKPELEGGMRDLATDRLNQRLSYIDEHLSSNDFLLGDQFTVADTYLHMICRWPAMVSMDISQYKNIASYQARIAARPAVAEALADLG